MSKYNYPSCGEGVPPAQNIQSKCSTAYKLAIPIRNCQETLTNHSVCSVGRQVLINLRTWRPHYKPIF